MNNSDQQSGGSGLGSMLMPALAAGGVGAGAYGLHRAGALNGLKKILSSRGAATAEQGMAGAAGAAGRAPLNIPPPPPAMGRAMPPPVPRPAPSEAGEAVSSMMGRSTPTPATGYNQEPPDLQSLIQMQRGGMKAAHYLRGKTAALLHLGLH